MPENNEIIIHTTPEGKETFEVNLKKDTMVKVIVNLINQNNLKVTENFFHKKEGLLKLM